jgi:hypothetical protein
VFGLAESDDPLESLLAPSAKSSSTLAVPARI